MTRLQDPERALPVSLRTLHRHRASQHRDRLAQKQRHRDRLTLLAKRREAIRRRSKERERRRQARVATYQPPPSAKQPAVPMDALKALADVYQASRALMVQDHQLESLPLARTLFEMLLRLSWAKVSGKPNTRSEPASIPNKLYQRAVIDKRGLRQMTKVVSNDGKTYELLACCSALMDWLAND